MVEMSGRVRQSMFTATLLTYNLSCSPFCFEVELLQFRSRQAVADVEQSMKVVTNVTMLLGTH